MGPSRVTAALGILPSRHWHIHVRQVTSKTEDTDSNATQSAHR